MNKMSDFDRAMSDVPIKQLRYLLVRYGRSICKDPKRCEGLLRDLCPQYKREINVLIGALKENVVLDLTALSKTTPQAILIKQLTIRLYENLGIAKEFGRWAVSSWASVLENSLDKSVSKSCRPLKLRSTPRSFSEKEARKFLGLNRKWRPQRYLNHVYQDNRNSTITDKATGLIWQKSGAGFTLYDQTVAYINTLNTHSFGGYNNWRLPSMEELMSLLEASPQPNSLYINPIFDKTQVWCWSLDIRPDGGAWSVHFGSGEIRWNFLSCNIRAVRS